MLCQTKVIRKFWIIYPLHEIVDDNVDKFKNQVMSAVNEGYKNIIINLGSVDFIDSKSLGVLVSIYKTILSKNGKLVFTCPTDRIKKIFQLTRLDRIMDVKSNDDEVIEEH